MRARTVLAAVAAVAATALALPVTPAGAAPKCKDVNTVPTNASLDQARNATLCLLNAQRRRHRLPKLRENAKLRVAAERHSEDMEQRGYFDHVTPAGLTSLARVKLTGYLKRATTYFVGENLAWGTGGLSSPRSIVRGWMKSPGHRANILNRRFRDVGIGVVIGAPQSVDDGATYTTSFGSRG